MNRQQNSVSARVSLFAFCVLAVLILLANRAVPFMMDDFWYSTNLATGEKLQSLSDVVEGQIWHYLNWGGRSMTHTALQLTLMAGETAADILNWIMVLILIFLMAEAGKIRKPIHPLFLLSAVYAFNANVEMSTLWQAGVVNYVYSSVWILAFLLPYLKALNHRESRKGFPVAIFIVPFGLLAGWSNENMGPTCFVLSVGIVAFLYWKEKRKPALWMILGSISSLVGSVLVIAAPGNFLRSSVIEKPGPKERLLSMLTAGVDYLLPCALAVVGLFLIRSFVVKTPIRRSQWVFLAGAVLSYGAMVLSPHYPDRATYGTMVFCVILAGTILEELDGRILRSVTVCFWLCAAAKLLMECLR